MTIPKNGEAVLFRSSGELQGLALKRLSPTDTKTVLTFRQQIFAGLSDPDFVLPEDDEEAWAEAHLGQTGVTIGAFSNGAMVAYASLLLPSAEDPENLGLLCGVAREDLGQVAHMASCMVIPPFRGRQIQRHLIRVRLDEAKRAERSTVLALTSTHNFPSRRNLVAEDFRIIWAGETAPGRFRHVLQYVPMKGQRESHAVEYVAPTDLLHQSLLLGKGYVGGVEAPNKRDLVFYRPA